MKLNPKSILYAVSFLTFACGDGNTQDKKSPPFKKPVAGEKRVSQENPLQLTASERQEMKELTSNGGRKLGLAIYDEDDHLIAKSIVEPKTMASAKLCIVEGAKAALTAVQVFVSCCDKVGIKDVEWTQLDEYCWQVSPVYCGNANYKMHFAFGDGDSAHYLNAEQFPASNKKKI